MTANIFGDRFLGRREPGWHNLGTVFTEPLTAVEAATQSGVDQIVVEKRELSVDLGGVWTSFGRHAIVRLPTPDDNQYRVFGECAPDYGIVQHGDLARHLDKLTQKWPVETMGALGHGETVFMTLDAGQHEVQGDPIRSYFLLADTKDGKSGIRLLFTPVRVVCQNTLISGEASAVATASLRHTADVEEELAWRLDLVKELQDISEKVLHHFELMATIALEEGAAEKIIAKAYPYPRKPAKVKLAEDLTPEQAAQVGGMLDRVDRAEREWVNATQRQDERRDAALELYERFNDEIDQRHLARTPWAAYNAVVECEDFREEVGKEDADYSLLFGLRARSKHRAYNAALAWTEPEYEFAEAEVEAK